MALAEHGSAVAVEPQYLGQAGRWTEDGRSSCQENAVPISATPPMLALCELRPVRRATRVGEHTGAVCRSLAVPGKALKAGIWIGPPKHPGSPNPKLSIKKMKTTFGAPAPFGWLQLEARGALALRAAH